jgi:hypothetical protein
MAANKSTVLNSTFHQICWSTLLFTSKQPLKFFFLFWRPWASHFTSIALHADDLNLVNFKMFVRVCTERPRSGIKESNSIELCNKIFTNFLCQFRLVCPSLWAINSNCEERYCLILWMRRNTKIPCSWVSMPGQAKEPTQWVMCNLLWTPLLNMAELLGLWVKGAK